jgi:hypothetical protein
MKTRAKDAGTWWETHLANAARAFGLTARRLVEGSIYDEGDLELHDSNGDRWIIEAKNRMNLNAHDALAKAQRKAGEGTRVVLAWRRMMRVPDKQRRVSAGPPLVCMDVPTFLDLVSRVRDAEESAA